ncbi:SOUL family heme-binding protein [Citricoccus zhacaiensis]|uniref:SOUL family heme-binding protein n=2 Tax=Citricoccus TaxID=169133 RepID=UPI003CF20508
MTAHQPYETLRGHDGVEVRRYPEHVLAETTVEAGFEDAGNRAFRILFGYISGTNQAEQKVAMTAPVLQDCQGTAGSPCRRTVGVPVGGHVISLSADT